MYAVGFFILFLLISKFFRLYCKSKGGILVYYKKKSLYFLLVLLLIVFSFVTYYFFVQENEYTIQLHETQSKYETKEERNKHATQLINNFIKETNTVNYKILKRDDSDNRGNSASLDILVSRFGIYLLKKNDLVEITWKVSHMSIPSSLDDWRKP